MDFFIKQKKELIMYLSIILLLITLIIVTLLKKENIVSKEKINDIQLTEIKESNDIKEIETKEIEKENEKEIKVDIKGAVKKPGVYTLKEGNIVEDVIEQAGGLNKNASTKYINLSKKIKDEMVINIFTNYEILKKKETNEISTKEKESEDVTSIVKEECVAKTEVIKECDNASIIVTEENDLSEETKEETIETEITTSLVNINTAPIEQLTTLTGIGEAKAKSIIEYRTNNGKFNKIEDIMNVSGIGESAFQKIKDNITI